MPHIAGNVPFRGEKCARIVDKQIECAVSAWVAEGCPSIVEVFSLVNALYLDLIIHPGDNWGICNKDGVASC
jgi:hypothetical protein